MKKSHKIFLFIAVGAMFLVWGYNIWQFIGGAGDNILRVNPVVAAAVFIGCGLLVVAFIGHGFFFARKHPEKLKQQQIESEDERNNTIREKAGLTAWSIITVMLGGLAGYSFIFDFGFPFWLPLGLFVISFASFIVSNIVYNKKM